jgi:hypothetical protein
MFQYILLHALITNFILLEYISYYVGYILYYVGVFS